MVLAIKSVIEAEDFTLEFGFQRTSASYASAGAMVQANASNSAMRTVWTGPTGIYNLQLTYFDENDGIATSRIERDGTILDSWSWNKNLGSGFAGDRTRTTRTVENVELETGDVIRIAGSRSVGEPLRIDRLDVLPPSSRGEGAPLLAFDSVEGFGSDTIGGRGGHVVQVTNLNDRGVGSLRWALEDLEFPRIVIFDIGGRINLLSEINVNGDVTLAGQTAPGGITVSGGRLQVVGDNVIIRGMKMRPGDGPGQELSKRDAISIGTVHNVVNNVVVDSNSMTWATDENLGIWGQVRDVTVSNNIIAEGLQASGVSKGGLIGRDSGQNGRDISILKNLWVSNDFRNVHMKDQSNVEFANNLVHNYGASHQGLLLGGGSDTLSAAIISNVYFRGPSTTYASQPAFDLRYLNTGSRIYLEGNRIEGHIEPGDNQRSGAHGRLEMLTSSQPFTGSGFEKLHANDVFDFVINNAGARHYERGLDAIDSRIVNDVLNGGGRILLSQKEVGGYLASQAVTKLKDTDGDGIPDIYETIIGADPNRYDAHSISPMSGYSNIETYINGLIDGFNFVSDSAPKTPPPPPSSTPTPLSIVGLEKFQLVEGFYVDRNPLARDGLLVRVDDGASGRAQMIFDGKDGDYALTIRYFDENDGVSRSSVRLNGATVDEWSWNRSGTTNFVTEATITDRNLGIVSLERGDVIEVSGVSDQLEPLRIDYLQLQEVLIG